MALAVTSLVVIAFTVPLMLVVRRQAAERAQLNAEREAQNVAGLVALLISGSETLEPASIEASLGQLPPGLAVYFPDGESIGATGSNSQVSLSTRRGVPASGVDVDGDWEVGIPISTRGGIVAVVSTATVAEQSSGVGVASLVLAGLGLVIVAIAVLVTMRLVGELIKPVDQLAEVAERLGEGDLKTRAVLDGPPELAAVATALNGLATRLSGLIEAERESLADLSHRLRTPLTSLRLQAERVPVAEDRIALTQAVDRMQTAVDGLIHDVRQGRKASMTGDLAAVVRRRLPFWQVLAQEQKRPIVQSIASGLAVVNASEEDLATLLDVLIGNVFAHTDAGVAMAVDVRSQNGQAVLTVGDAGPGFPPGLDLTARGVSGGGSTGLGLDIVRKIAIAAGGGISTGPAAMGGAEVLVRLPLTA
ncbi:HAMP domain-containing sensor histidine kinase [soil metagenome]